jgi:2-amino-4-hydroxy-6-hydroxymethyldihydropteridine diphosphokinase
MSVLAHIGLGSNLASPREQLARATRGLAHLPRTALVAVSSSYVSEPIGTHDAQPDYVNAIAAVRTSLSPRRLLSALQRIERAQGRTRGVRNAARTLDLDLLLYGRLKLRTRGLHVPHPRLHRRAFVLRPLLEIDPAAHIAGRGPARRYLAATRGQRLGRARG